MTQFKKLLLAGTASFALIATPALAIDALGGASGAVSGATSGAADVTGSVSGNEVGGKAESATDVGASAGTSGGNAAVDAGASGSADGDAAGLSTGAKGGVAVSGEADGPSPAEIGNSIEGAANASKEAVGNMTGKAKDAVTDAASTGEALSAEGKGAVSSETEAGVDKGASLRGNVVNETVAQVETGADAATDAASDATTTPAPTAPELDPTSKLTEMGYTDIEPVEGAAEASNESTFSATNADGEKVNVVVDTTTGAVVSEQEPADDTDKM